MRGRGLGRACAPSPDKKRLYPGIAPGWVYYFRPTIAAFVITGTNPYY